MHAWRNNGGFLIRDQKKVPMDLDYGLAAGMDVVLELNGHEYRITVIEIQADSAIGAIKTIGPLPALEANGLRVGDQVDFMQDHVLRIIPS